eukprot:gene39623-63346_t
MAEQSVIIVPLDWSEQSLIALEQAANVAETLHSNLHLVHVKDAPSIFSKSETDEQEGLILQKLKESADELEKDRGITVTYEVRSGKIYDQINQVAEEKD